MPGRRLNLLLLAAGLTLAVLTATASTAAASPAPCSTAGLVVWLDTQGNGALGTTYYQLKLTNLSDRACTLFGYPGVSAVDLAGRQIGRAASRNPVHAPKRITLASGGTANVVLGIVDAANFSSSICHPVSAAGLRVYPPNQTAAKIVPFPFHACNGPNDLVVQAVQR